MKFASPLITVLVFLTSIQLCLSTEDQSKRGDSLKSTLSHLRIMSTEDHKSPQEAFHHYLEKVKQNHDDSTRRACCLLLDNYSHFQESDFRSFLSLEPVASYLKKEDLDENYKNILIACSLFYGLGGQPQNEGAACDLLELVREKAPPSLKAVGGVLIWKFFQEAGYLSAMRKSRKEKPRDDVSVLTVLMSATTGRLESALQLLQEVSAYSGLCITVTSIPQNPQNPTNLPSIMAAMKLPMVRPNKTHNHPQMHHFYFLMALATTLQPFNQPPQLFSVPLGGNLMLQSFPCPERLRDVYSCVIEVERQRQKKAEGEQYFVNLISLQNSPLFQSLFIPLSLSSSTPLQPVAEGQILQLKQYFQKEGGLETSVVDQFFEDLHGRTTLLEKAQIVARLERLRSQLVYVAQHHLKDVLGTLVLSNTFSYTLMQFEWTLLKKQEVNEEDKLLHLIAIGLNEKLTNTVLSLPRRTGKGTIDEEKYYGNIFEDFLFLSAERSPLTAGIGVGMKPAHAALAVLRGEPDFPGWADPNTLIDIAYNIVRMHPDMVIDWLEVHHDERIKRAISRLQTSGESVLEKLVAFVKTSNGKEVKRDVIPYLLMHEQLNYLSDVPDYK